MTYEFAVTEFKYRVLYLAEFLSQFDDMAASDWPESPAWNDLVSFFTGNQLGLQIAFATQHEMVSCLPYGEKVINETWEDFMKLTMDGDGAFDLEPADHMLAMILENIEQNY
jgi:hypothetical protein